MYVLCVCVCTCMYYVLCVCMCVCVLCVCMYYVCICIVLCVCARMYVRVCMCLCYVCVCIMCYVCVCVYAHVYVRVCVCVLTFAVTSWTRIGSSWLWSNHKHPCSKEQSRSATCSHSVYIQLQHKMYRSKHVHHKPNSYHNTLYQDYIIYVYVSCRHAYGTLHYNNTV